MELAAGVWAAAHEDHGYAVSNAGIVDLGDRTLVFDTFLTPEAAAELRAAAEALTGRPAALVVNSHAHNDHIRGSQVFRPEAEIVSTWATRDAIARLEPEQIAYEREHAPARAASMRALLQDATAEERVELRMWLDYYEGMIGSHATLVPTLPTLTFDGTLTLHGPKRTAELRSTGRGHTEDDVVLFLPDDRIAFLGDLLFVERHPWLGDGDTEAWSQTLRAVHGWGVDTVVPGHGPVSPAAALLTMAEYIDTLSALVRAHRDAGGSLDETATLAVPERYASWWYGRFYPPNLRYLYTRLDQASRPENR